MEGARVQSLEALGVAKVALVDLKERLGTALSEASTDLDRFAQWLEREQPVLLTGLLRRQEEQVTMAKSALYRKQMVVSAKDSKPSVVDEKKALQRAIERAEDTRLRLRAVKRWAIEFQRELLLFKGACTGMQSAVDHDLPLAIATVTRMAVALERYVAERPPDLARLVPEAAVADVPGGREAGAGDAAHLPSIRRPEEEAAAEGDGPPGEAEAGERGGSGGASP